MQVRGLDSLDHEIAAALNASAAVKMELAARGTAAVKAAVLSITEALAAGNKVMLMGNGGSAADAQHIAAELVGRFKLERGALPAISLCTDPSVITAVGNDYGYEYLFARQVEALARPGDVAVGITTSGRSPNVLKALQTARSLGCITIGLTGQNPGGLQDICDILVSVPSDVTARVQEAHTAVGHVICELVERLINNRVSGQGE